MTERMEAETSIGAAPCPACALCGRDGELLYEGLSDDLLGAPGFWSMRRCSDEGCGLLWLDPKPLETDLVKAYARYHTHTKTAPRGAMQWWLSFVNAACRQASRLLGAFSELGEQRRRMKTMYLDGFSPGALLEVGCGGGRFLDRMRRAGWAVEGVELDPNAASRVQRKYGIPVHTGTLAQVRYASDRFDVVAMSQVLEHAHNPIALLRECRRVLRPGGFLVLTTPNSRSQAHAMYGRHWRGLEPPRHLQVFTPEALERCAHLAGFGEIRTMTLSAESAGIYRASEEIKVRAEGGETAASRTARILRSWWMQHVEFRADRRNRGRGQDILLRAQK